MKKYGLVVIGGGPAGITLAKMLGKSMKMAVIRPEDHSMIYCAMPYVIEGLMESGKTLKKDSLVTDSGADLIRKMASSINFSAKKIVFDDSTSIGWDKLIIATGATPFIPPVPGSDLKGVMGFKTENDLRAVMEMLGDGLKRIVVVGAGAIGIELALALKARGAEIDLVDMAGSILPNLLDPEMSEQPGEELIAAGIHLHLNEKVVELRGTSFVEKVILDKGQTIDFVQTGDCTGEPDSRLHGLVIFAAGMKPELSLIKDSPVELGSGGIIVNALMETNIPGVFAVGDCAQFTSGITGDPVPGRLATNAVPMARIAALNILGRSRRYPGFYNGAATKVGDYFAGGTGLTEAAAKAAGIEPVCGYSELTTRFPIMPGVKKIRTKLVVDSETRRVIGGQLVSGEPVTGRIDLITFAIQKEATVDDLALLSYSAQPYQSFYPAANNIVLAAEDIIGKLDN